LKGLKDKSFSYMLSLFLTENGKPEISLNTGLLNETIYVKSIGDDHCLSVYVFLGGLAQ